MKTAFLAPLCVFAIACGGTQNATEPSVPPATTPDSQSRPEQARASSDDSHFDINEALRRLTREQKETLRVVQHMAHKVEVLQIELAELRDEQEELKNQPAPSLLPRRPKRARPNPLSIYSIPIQDNPSRGSKRPLVTIIKGFEFA